MKTYEVTITETLQKTVEVEAICCDEAEYLIKIAWKKGDYILDADAFVGVDISAKEKMRHRDYER